MYIGLVSDTHNTFDGPFMDFLAPVDEIWHAGDFGSVEVAERIAAFKPLRGVYGNCDPQELRYDYPLFLDFECGGMKILMTHIGGYPGRYDRKALALIEEYRPDIFICGHSHILKIMNDTKRGILVINPGAAGIYGFHIVRTALRFRIENGHISDMEIFELPKSKGHIL
ncbi:MAG: metallophosphatase family protein [Clostridium sp.]|nr:metallophosphatase family protein [Bacteroides sp.]MCM1197390.1 metallophosphatase family protein [Clostridium sp.]